TTTAGRGALVSATQPTLVRHGDTFAPGYSRPRTLAPEHCTLFPLVTLQPQLVPMYPPPKANVGNCAGRQAMPIARFRQRDSVLVNRPGFFGDSRPWERGWDDAREGEGFDDSKV